MSNNYCQMCMDVHVKTHEGRAWLQTQYEALEGLQEVIADGDTELSDETFYEDANKLLVEDGDPPVDDALLACVKRWDPIGTTPLLGFELEVESDGDVTITDDSENAELERIADFLQIYLQRHDPEGVQTFEYAFTGDKHRPGTFGGGACFITKDKIEWIATNNWLAEKMAAHEEGLKAREDKSHDD